MDCPCCSAACPKTARFCPSCGARLQGASARGGGAEGGEDWLARERKTVTCLFADVVGFTVLSERSDPEDVDRVLREYAAVARHAVEIYGGTVEKFIGDAVVAVFGVPVAHEDDAERAVHAALRIQADIGRVRRPDARPLRVRVGVDTGEILARLDAEVRTGEGFLTGDSVNTAARLQAAAPADGILVGPTTYALTSRLFFYEELEPVWLKGKSEPLPVWLVRGAVARTGASRPADFSTSFVGRRRELSWLITIFQTALAERRMNVALVSGEAGVGKSRLVAEFYQSLDKGSLVFAWRQGRCLPYGEGISFWALRDVVKAQAGILDNDSAEMVARKLERALPADEHRQWVVSRLRPLVGLEAPPESRDENFSAWMLALEQLARRRPLIVVIEDLHWADDAMLAFLRALITKGLEAPFMLLLTARTQFAETQAAFVDLLGAANLMRLAPLRTSDASRLVTGLLGEGCVRPDLPTAIADRCDGNPLYLEQVVRLLAERGLLHPGSEELGVIEAVESGLPESARAVIAARIDALPRRVKSLLADAAIVGRHFWDGVLTALSGDGEEMEDGLGQLITAELIRPAPASSLGGQREFVFVHGLTQDVAYHQQPRDVRAARHERVARWFERHAPERADDYADVLAHHYVRALELRSALGDQEAASGLTAPAVCYLRIAAARALALDVAAAERLARHAVTLAPVRTAARGQALAVWGDCLMQAGKMREARDALGEAVEELLAAGRKREGATAMCRLSYALSLLGESRETPLEEEALALLEDDPPSTALVEVTCSCASGAVHTGHPQRALELTRRVADAGVRLEQPVSVKVLELRGMAQTLLGDEQAVVSFSRAVELSRRQDIGHAACALGANFAESLLLFQGPRAAVDRLRETFEMARVRRDELAQGYCRYLIWTYGSWMGEWSEGLEEAAHLDARLETEGDLWDLQTLRATRALILALMGRPAEAEPLAAWAEETSRALSALPFTRVVSLVSLAEVRRALGRSDDARRLLADCAAVGPGARGQSDYVQRLPHALRTAMDLGEPELATRLAEGTPSGSRFAACVLTAFEGMLAADARKYHAATERLREAAAGWERLALPYEAAQARLSGARAMAGLGRHGDARRLADEARETFRHLDARPALTATDALIESISREEAGRPPGREDRAAPG